MRQMTPLQIDNSMKPYPQYGAMLLETLKEIEVWGNLG